MISDELRRLRKMKGLTQLQLATRLNVSQASIASWENGTRRPDVDFLPTLANFYGVSIGELYGISNAPSIDEKTKAMLTDFAQLAPAEQQRVLDFVSGILSTHAQ